MTIKKETRGGARNKAGRKSQVYSDYLKKQIVEALKRKAKDTGVTLGDVMVDIAYSDERSLGNLRPPVLKIICDSLLVKATESEVTHNVNQGPTIGLPPVIPVPKRQDEEVEQRLHG